MSGVYKCDLGEVVHGSIARVVKRRDVLQLNRRDIDTDSSHAWGNPKFKQAISLRKANVSCSRLVSYDEMPISDWLDLYVSLSILV